MWKGLLMNRCFTFFLSALLLVTPPGYTVVINEISAANSSIKADEDGEFSDWLELFNETDRAVQLRGFYLSDNPGEMKKWKVPDTTMASRSFLLVWCSGKDKYQTELHASFKLDRDGECILLSTSENEIVDSLTYPPLPADVTYGRHPDGAAGFVLFREPTPNAPNETDIEMVAAATPVFSEPAGFYSGPLELKIASATPGSEIRYTSDGSEPDRTSLRYDGKIRIESTCMIRAVAFASGMNPSPISTHSFFVAIQAGLNDLPVLSLITDPENLWDPETGIYVNPLETGDEWERPVSAEFFERDKSLGFSRDAGIRIHGGASRFPQKSAKKSFRLYFRGEYGVNQLEYPIIHSTENTLFNRLVLRAGFNDSWIHWLDLERELATYVRDPLVRDIFMDMGEPASSGDFTHLFLNGDYWGLYNISERYDDAFCDIHIESGDWDVVKPGPDELQNAIEATEGDLAAWNDFMRWTRSSDFAGESNYKELGQWVEVDNLLNFYILNIYSQNHDWPRHNWYAARKRDKGRWIFMPWDCEWAFGTGSEGYSHSMNIWDVIEGQVQYPLPSLLSKLKKSGQFRDQVAIRCATLFTAQLSQDNLLSLLEKRLDQIRGAIPFEAERWGGVRTPDVYDLNDWLAAAESMRKFIRNRQPILKGQLLAEGFSATSMELPESWHQTDIGDVQIKGFASYRDGTFTIDGSGADIWNSEDEFYYVWTAFSGDVDISARVTSLADTDDRAKAGVMIRNSYYGTAANVFMALTPNKGTFQYRPQNAAASVSTPVEGITAPHWVRLQRTGDVFKSYHCADGTSWIPVDSVTISMRQIAAVGLAVTAHHDGLLCTAAFDNVLMNGAPVYTGDRIVTPARFDLLQNYPNPFNAVTTIKFSLSKDTHVKVSIFNIRGSLVETICQGFFHAGCHNVGWNASHLSTGTYFIRLDTEDYLEIEKSLLLK
jgi:hypothetical protein